MPKLDLTAALALALILPATAEPKHVTTQPLPDNDAAKRPDQMPERPERKLAS